MRKLKQKLNSRFRSPIDGLKQQSGIEGNTPAGNEGSSNAPANPNIASISSEYGEASIRELWNLAYEKLREEDEVLIKDYEARLYGDLSVGLSSPLGSKVGMRDRAQAILQRKMDEVNRDVWKLKFGSSEAQVRDLVQPVLGVVNWVNDYIKVAVSASPHASMAWVGVSLLLPLFLNPSEQGISLAKGLEYISSLIVRSWMWEDLYVRRYEAGTSQNKSSLPSHSAYKISLEKLYRQILRFQATSYCYYTEKTAFRLGLDIVKWNEWDKLLDEIKDKEREFAATSDNWRDMKYDEACSEADKRHQEAIRRWQTIGTDVSGLREAVEAARAEKTRDELLDWLCKVDHSEMYNAARDKHESGTCKWLVRDSEEFKTWEGSPSSLLWLHGNAGSGKSILSSSVVKYLQDRYASDPQSAFAYFFFSFSDMKKQEVGVMLASLIKQLYASRPDTPQPIKNLGEYKKRGERPDTKTLENALIATANGFSSVSIVIDALDECPTLNGERSKLLGSLNRIIDAMPDNFHIFCTSRPEPDIKAAISIVPSSPSRADIDLTAETRGVNYDIGLYIDSVFASTNYNSWPSDLKAEAKALLIERADGMFQYIFCQFEALHNLSSIPRIRNALQQLPIGLDATYARLLQSIDTNFQTQVASLLKWLAFSNQPLNVEQLAEIFILDTNRVVAFDEAERLLKPEDCLRYTSSLVVTQRSGSQPVARLAHFSVREYLRSDRIAEGPAARFSFTESEAHLHIAHSCLAYHLQHSALSGKDVERLRLREYAARNWMQHLEIVPHEAWPTGVTLLAARALAIRSESLRLSIRYLENRLDNMLFPNMLQQPQFFTARFGFRQLTNMLLYSGPGRNEYLTQRDWDMTLQGAAYGGSMAIVQLLLNRHSLRINTGNGTLALHAAASQGHATIVKLLLDRGADINSRAGADGTALHKAASDTQHSRKRFHLLLERGADVNAQGGRYGYPLQAVCAHYHELRKAEVELLLEKGADVNAQGGKYGTALQAACARLNQDLVELLLEKGANIGIQGGQYGNALQAACFTGKLGAVLLLLDRGADINAQGGEYGNALQAACVYRRLNIVQLLLDRGADVNAQGGEYGSALQAAARAFDSGDKLLELLLGKGANVNQHGGFYGTALQAACLRGKITTVRLLLNHGAEVNAQGGRYGSAAQAACMGGNGGAILRLLIEHRADVHGQEGPFGNAWHAAAVSGSTYTNIDVLSLLLDHGHDINDTRVPEYGTALQAAIEAESLYDDSVQIDRIRFLLGRGADVNVKAGRYGFPLQSACATKCGVGHVGFLLQNCPEVDVNAAGGEFGSALQAAAFSGHMSSVKLLLDNGAHINARGGKYGSALNAAIVQGFWDIVEVLLDNGAKSDRQQLPKPDEEWLARIQEDDKMEDGKESVERYRIFWEKQPIGEDEIET
ncbi:ankyrin repeat-containing domain protein [Xylaria acuta]|nr:ankyrin repeat-containing domain protein [Xylaria acuta]